jgi:hypothetical protein
MRAYLEMGVSWWWSQITPQVQRLRLEQAGRLYVPAFKCKPKIHNIRESSRGQDCASVGCSDPPMVSSGPMLYCRRTVDYTGPYLRLLQERLKLPDRHSIRLMPPTAAGALKVTATD